MIIGIITAITFPLYNTFVENIEYKVCENNRIMLENNYKTYLEYEQIEDKEMVFNDFLDEYDQKICPDGGEIIYKDGHILCTKHSNIIDDTEDQPVPYLYDYHLKIMME